MVDKLVIPTLSEDACQLALHSRHLDLSLPSQVWIQIMNATIDHSLGEGLARRHPILDPDGAQVLGDYYGRTAAAFMAWGIASGRASVRRPRSTSGTPSERPRFQAET